MDIIQLIAGVVVVLGLLELALFVLDPELPLTIEEGLHKNVPLAQAIYTMLAGLILYFLLQAGLSITEIIAVGALALCITGIAFAPVCGRVIEALEDHLEEETFWVRFGPVAIITALLLIWGARDLFLRF